MGLHYLFTCRCCGFEATVSGGFDVGFACVKHTYGCRECGALFDRTVSDAPWAFDRKDVPRKVSCRENPGSPATRPSSGIILGDARNVEIHFVEQKNVSFAGIDVKRTRSTIAGGS